MVRPRHIFLVPARAAPSWLIVWKRSHWSAGLFSRIRKHSRSKASAISPALRFQIDVGKIVHAFERIGTVRAQLRPPQREKLLEQPDGLERSGRRLDTPGRGCSS